jgi:septal ring factor EnvC (AmiA/AmiB activator)
MNVLPNAQVQGADRLDFDAGANRSIAIFELAAQSRSERPVSTTEGLVTSHKFKRVQSTWLLNLANAATVPAAERAVLTEAAARQKELEEATKDLEKNRSELKKIEKEVERMQEHLKAMVHDTSAGAAQSPMVKRVLDTEDRLTAQQKKIEALEADQERRQDVVRKTLEKLPKSSSKPPR